MLELTRHCLIAFWMSRNTFAQALNLQPMNLHVHQLSYPSLRCQPSMETFFDGRTSGSSFVFQYMTDQVFPRKRSWCTSRMPSRTRPPKVWLQGITKSSDHYDEAVKCRQERYNRPRQINLTHVLYVTLLKHLHWKMVRQGNPYALQSS